MDGPWTQFAAPDAPSASGPWTLFAPTPPTSAGEYGFAPAAAEQASSNPNAVPAAGAQFITMPGGEKRQVGLAPGETAGLQAGFNRGFRDVVDRPAEWLARGSDAIGMTSGEGDRVAAGNTADRQAYEQQHSADGFADLGRAGSQLAVALPIGGAVGELAGGAGDLISAGAGRVSPTLGAAADRIGSFIAGTGGGAGSLGSRAEQAGSVITSSALQGAGAGALVSGQSSEPVARQALRGGAFGAVIGPAARTTGAAYTAVADALGGGPVNPELQRLGRLARDKYDINVTGDMISPSPVAQNIGAALRQIPGSGMTPARAALQTQFTKAVGNTIGENVEQITPTVMERAAKRIGGVMDGVAAATPSIPAEGLVDGLAHVQNDASFLTQEQQGVVNKHINNVMDAIGPGDTITGEQYQSLTKFNSPLGKALRSSDSDVRNAAIEIRGHLDDALAQSLPEGSPIAQQLKDARLQYKNLKTIEPLVVKGEPGEISPMALQGQVNRSFKGRAMREAQPDLGELADIGHRFDLRPDSGTAGRTMINATVGAAGGVGASLLGGNPMNALYTLGAAGAAVGAGRVAGSVLRSPTYINKLLTPVGPDIGPSLANKLLPYVAPASAILAARGANGVPPAAGTQGR